MSIKKKQRVLFHLLLFTFFVLIIGGNFDYSAESTQTHREMRALMNDGHWKLPDTNYASMLNSNVVSDSGHQLIYQVTRDGCQQSALRLRLNMTGSLHAIQPGQLVRLNVHLGERRAMIYTPVTSLNSSSGQDSQIELANSLINSQLRDDLQLSDKITFEILEPINLAVAVDQPMTFSLSGFDNAHALLQRLCEAEPIEQESSYTLLHAVL